MTTNNLREHLQWLLRSRCFVPPESGVPTTTSLQASPSVLEANSPGEGAAITARTGGSESFKDVRASVSEPTRPNTVQVPRPETTSDRHADAGRKANNQSDMARLQAAPFSAGKPKLVSQAKPQAARSATAVTAAVGTSLSDRYNAQCRSRQQASLSQSTPLQRRDDPINRSYPAAQLPTPALSSTGKSSFIIESVDLTGEDDSKRLSSETLEEFGEPRQIWREDSASRQEPVTKRGKKRKSDSLGEEVPSPEELPRKKPAGAPGQGSKSDGFVVIDDYPIEAPPPYSNKSSRPQPASHNTFAGRSSQKTSHPQIEDTQDGYETPDGLFEEQTITETTVMTQTHTRRPVSKTSGSQSTPPKQDWHALPIRSPSRLGSQSSLSHQSPKGSQPKAPRVRDNLEAARGQTSLTKKKRTRVVQDSDDEDLSDGQPGNAKREQIQLESFDIVAKVPASSPVAAGSSRKERPLLSLSGGLLGSTPRQIPDSSPFVKGSTISLPPDVTASPFHRDSPTKPNTSEGGSLYPVINPSPPPEVPDPKTIEQFLKQPSSLIEQSFARTQRDFDENQLAVSRCIDSGQPIPALLQSQRKDLKGKLELLESLRTLTEQHAQLQDQREDLKQQIFAALDQNLEFTTLQSENTRISSEIRGLESRIGQVLQSLPEVVCSIGAQGDRLERRPTTTFVRTPEVMVQSTPRHRPERSNHDQQPGYMKSFPGNLDARGSSDSLRSATASRRLTEPDLHHGSATEPYKQRTNPRMELPVGTDSQIRAGRAMQPFSAGVRSDFGANPRPMNPTQTNKTTPVTPGRSRWEGGLEEVVDDSNYGEDDDMFDRIMGSPPRLTTADHDDFGQDDDEEMLEMADSFEKQDQTDRREVFAETSGNSAITGRQTPVLSKPRVAYPQEATSAALLQHPWSRDVKAAMKERFHLRGFRQNQLEAINATLSGKDAFVLMPTGGGKSLCYQLPAVISSGHTRGVTIVISPLLSLMQDQVEHLKALNVQAFLINGEVSTEHRRLVMDGLNDFNAEQLVQILYVTPEMITKSDALIRAFENLHRRKRLARIVIDEAHCVSQWGHDFRPDYKALGSVRKQFRGVPVMALTATATENVKVDVIHNLNIDGCEVFTQSFNRPNLTYEVRPKTKAQEVLDSMVETIRASYKGQSGIIYCLSRVECEKLTGKLRDQYGIKAHHYHAGMKPQEKNQVQKDWQAGRHHVIVATIAFGMGIDKPDVRFVFHHSIPKSLEGYYQETGRAGRDGKRSGCYLYYGYRDTATLKRFIDDSDGNWEQKERGRLMLRNMVNFCENRSDCRRVQVLAYFNESFRREDCNSACDNCNSKSTFESVDYSEHAASAIRLIQALDGRKLSILMCADMFRGVRARSKSVPEDASDFPGFGAGSGMDRQEIERLFHRLISEGALEEENIVNRAGFAHQSVQLGRNWKDFLEGRRKLKLQVRVSPRAPGKITNKPTKSGKKKSTTGVGVSKSRQDYPQSTNVSSPVQQATRRRQAKRNAEPEQSVSRAGDYEDDGFVVPDEAVLAAFSDSDDGFAPIRTAGKPRRSARAALGPPITMDEKMDRLNDVHRAVVDDFVRCAKEEGEKIRSDRGLREQPFTDSMYREMAINFPKDNKELLEIPGINADKVARYGSKFLKLIKQAHTAYENMMEHQEDRDNDPNHNVVISISSDEENDFEDEDSDDMGSQEYTNAEKSPYFSGNPNIEAFNAQFSQVSEMNKGKGKAPRSASQARDVGASAARSRGGGRGSFKKRTRGGISKNRSSGGSSRKTSAGSARSGAGGGTTQSVLSTSRGGSKKTASRGAGGGRGIGMMPI